MNDPWLVKVERMAGERCRGKTVQRRVARGAQQAQSSGSYGSSAQSIDHIACVQSPLAVTRLLQCPEWLTAQCRQRVQLEAGARQQAEEQPAAEGQQQHGRRQALLRDGTRPGLERGARHRESREEEEAWRGSTDRPWSPRREDRGCGVRTHRDPRRERRSSGAEHSPAVARRRASPQVSKRWENEARNKE